MERRRCRAGTSRRNTRVSWSYPTGKALIAPAVADNHLLWRTAGQPETRTDISFLERTDVARVPPGGAEHLRCRPSGRRHGRPVHRQQSRREPAADRPTRSADDGRSPRSPRIRRARGCTSSTITTTARSTSTLSTCRRLTLTDVTEVDRADRQVHCRHHTQCARSPGESVTCSGLTRTQIAEWHRCRGSARRVRRAIDRAGRLARHPATRGVGAQQPAAPGRATCGSGTSPLPRRRRWSPGSTTRPSGRC